MAKKIILIVVIILSAFTAGCWDMLDIEERAYVSGIAFDKTDPEEVERQKQILQHPTGFAPEYAITYYTPIPSALVGDATGAEAFRVQTTTAVSPMLAERQMASRYNLGLYFGHTDLALFGEEILKNPRIVKEMLDYLHRNQQFNWNVNVGVVQGEAKEALNVQPAGVQHLVEYITGIMNNRPITSYVSDVTLSQMVSEMGKRGTVALPRVSVEGDEVKVEGAALLKNFQLEGYFTGTEARGLQFLKGTLEGGVIMTMYKDVFVPYTIVNADVQPEIMLTDDGIKAKFTIESEGQLDEGKLGMELLDDKTIQEIEEEIAAEIVVNCEQVIKKMQEEYEVDVIYLGSHIQKFHPKVWKEIGEDWDEVFSEMDIEVEAEVHIRRIGVIK